MHHRIMLKVMSTTFFTTQSSAKMQNKGKDDAIAKTVLEQIAHILKLKLQNIERNKGYALISILTHFKHAKLVSVALIALTLGPSLNGLSVRPPNVSLIDEVNQQALSAFTIWSHHVIGRSWTIRHAGKRLSVQNNFANHKLIYAHALISILFFSPYVSAQNLKLSVREPITIPQNDTDTNEASRFEKLVKSDLWRDFLEHPSKGNTHKIRLEANPLRPDVTQMLTLLATSALDNRLDNDQTLIEIQRSWENFNKHYLEPLHFYGYLHLAPNSTKGYACIIFKFDDIENTQPFNKDVSLRIFSGRRSDNTSFDKDDTSASMVLPGDKVILIDSDKIDSIMNRWRELGNRVKHRSPEFLREAFETFDRQWDTEEQRSYLIRSFKVHEVAHFYQYINAIKYGGNDRLGLPIKTSEQIPVSFRAEIEHEFFASAMQLVAAQVSPKENGALMDIIPMVSILGENRLNDPPFGPSDISSTVF
jgi:hypothetical protein